MELCADFILYKFFMYLIFLINYAQVCARACSCALLLESPYLVDRPLLTVKGKHEPNADSALCAVCADYTFH